MLMRPFDELLQRRDQIVRAHRIAGRRTGPQSEANVIDPFQYHEPLHARLRQHVAIESGQRVHACAIAQQPVA